MDLRKNVYKADADRNGIIAKLPGGAITLSIPVGIIAAVVAGRPGLGLHHVPAHAPHPHRHDDLQGLHVRRRGRPVRLHRRDPHHRRLRARVQVTCDLNVLHARTVEKKLWLTLREAAPTPAPFPLTPMCRKARGGFFMPRAKPRQCTRMNRQHFAVITADVLLDSVFRAAYSRDDSNVANVIWALPWE